MTRTILFPVLLLIPFASGCSCPRVQNSEASRYSMADIVTVRPEAETMTRQKLPNFVGVSGKSAGAKALSMNLVIIPPGGSAQAHSHERFESAVYILKGNVKTRFGANLEKEVINQAGDFLFIPPDVPHQPVNLSATEEAVAVVSRNDPEEQEHVMLYEAK